MTEYIGAVKDSAGGMRSGGVRSETHVVTWLCFVVQQGSYSAFYLHCATAFMGCTWSIVRLRKMKLWNLFCESWNMLIG